MGRISKISYIKYINLFNGRRTGWMVEAVLGVEGGLGVEVTQKIVTIAEI
ncbi:hypothetical protein [Paenibacillus allorhizoplanae]|nr:hypothetical protein [Paenibacillus allorhizoplanae]